MKATPYYILLALSLLALLLPLPARGQVKKQSATSGPVDITARNLTYNKEQNIYTAQGDVEMVEGTRRLTADFVIYNDTTKDAFAEGHVIFQDPENVIHAERMSLNTVTKRGTIENGRVFVKQGNFYLTGNEIEKTGESSYTVHKGEFTTCGFDHPDWTFKAKDIDLTIEGYATAGNPTFSILGYPVLYMPWGIFPVKTERQSGFLLPQITSSSLDGRIFRDAYFWAIDKDKDATFYFDWIQNRGVKPGIEYRYAPTETTKGFWYGSFIDDKLYGGTRYQIVGQHEQTFGDINFKADINHVSDFDYLEDLGLTTVERSQNSLRSVAFAEKPFDRSLLTGEADYFQDLTQKHNDATVQQLPSLSYFTEYVPLLGQKLYGDVSSELTNFSPDTGEKATRFVASPTARVPYSLNGLNFLFSEGATEKSYLVDPTSPYGNSTQHHEAYTFQGDANATFLKNSSTSLFDLGTVQSIITPRVSYTYLKNDESFANIPNIDPSDRTNDANILTYSFDHYLNAIKDGQAREISLLEISQTYGLSQKLQPEPFLYYGSGNRLSDVHARLTLFPYPTGNFAIVTDDVLNIHGEGFTTMSNGVHYALPPWFQVDLSHSYAKTFLEPATEQISRDAANEVWLNTLTRWQNFDLNYQVWYSFIGNTWISSLLALTYHPSCWSITLSLSRTKRPSDTSFNFSFNLQGITQQIGTPQAASTGPLFAPAPQTAPTSPQLTPAPVAAPAAQVAPAVQTAQLAGGH